MSRIASVLFGQPLWPCLVRARLTFGIFAVCYDGFSDDQPRSHEARPRCESWISDLRFDGDEPSPLRKPVLRFPVLVQMGHLKPLGKPAQNSRKWFATAEIERVSPDLTWLDKAVRIVEKYVHDINAKQRRRPVSVNGAAPVAG